MTKDWREKPRRSASSPRATRRFSSQSCDGTEPAKVGSRSRPHRRAHEQHRGARSGGCPLGHVRARRNEARLRRSRRSAPWNIVPTAAGLVLVDWEESRFEDDPLFDLSHYVTRGSTPPRLAARDCRSPADQAGIGRMAVPRRDRPRSEVGRGAPPALPPTCGPANAVGTGSQLPSGDDGRACCRGTCAYPDEMAPGSLRILQVHNRYRQLGGEDAVVTAEADLLRSSGHEVIEHFVSNPTGSAAAAAALAAAPWNPASAGDARRRSFPARPTWLTCTTRGSVFRRRCSVPCTDPRFRW